MSSFRRKERNCRGRAERQISPERERNCRGGPEENRFEKIGAAVSGERSSGPAENGDNKKMKKRYMIKKAAAVVFCAGIAAGMGAVSAYASDGEEKSGFFSDLPQSLEEAADAASDMAQAAGEAASGLTQSASDLAGTVVEAATEFTQSAGDAASELADAAGETASGLADAAGETASGLADAASELVNAAGETASGLADAAGEAASGLTELLSELTGGLSDSAAEGAEEILQALGETLPELSEAVADFVKDSCETASQAAREAMEQLKENSARVMEVARDAVSGMDSLDSENRDAIRAVIRRAMGEANEQGLFGRSLRPETLDILADLASGAILYGDLYRNGEISVWEYAGNMSAVIFKAGLPLGAEFLGNLLPVPGAGYLAREAAVYLLYNCEGEELTDLFSPVLPDSFAETEQELSETPDTELPAETEADL